MINTRAATTRALEQYTRLGTRTEMESASQHRLIQMLMEGALTRILKARNFIRNGDVRMKGEFISMAISIIGGLRDSLDHEAGAELAGNLDRLYEYMSRRLLEANATANTEILDEVHALLTQIKSAWDAIGEQPLSATAAQATGMDVVQKLAV